MLLNMVSIRLTTLTILGFLWLPLMAIPLMWAKNKRAASKYRNSVGAIGFSFRYYLDTLIANPNVKMLSVDGVYPSVENIKSGAYAIVTPLYAVTYRECKNENAARLIDWILSDEGQFIIEETGYSGIK